MTPAEAPTTLGSHGLHDTNPAQQEAFTLVVCWWHCDLIVPANRSRREQILRVEASRAVHWNLCLTSSAAGV